MSKYKRRTVKDRNVTIINGNYHYVCHKHSLITCGFTSISLLKEHYKTVVFDYWAMRYMIERYILHYPYMLKRTII